MCTSRVSLFSAPALCFCPDRRGSPPPLLPRSTTLFLAPLPNFGRPAGLLLGTCPHAPWKPPSDRSAERPPGSRARDRPSVVFHRARDRLLPRGGVDGLACCFLRVACRVLRHGFLARLLTLYLLPPHCTGTSYYYYCYNPRCYYSNTKCVLMRQPTYLFGH